MQREGLDVPETTQLLYDLNRQGWDLPLGILDIDACAERVARLLRAQ